MWFISGFLAAILTLIDLSDAIYIPEKTKGKYGLYFLVLSFALVNGAFAIGLYFLLIDKPEFKSLGLPVWLSAVLIGAAYLALVRLKIATYKDKEHEIPLGIELLYEYLKKALIKHVKDCVLNARYEEASTCAANETLSSLVTKARFKGEKTLEGKELELTQGWILRILQDTNTNEYEKRLALCDFVLSGRRN